MRFRVFQDESGAWGWEVKGDNGQVSALSTPFTRRSDCELSLDRFLKRIREGEFTVDPRPGCR